MSAKITSCRLNYGTTCVEAGKPGSERAACELGIEATGIHHHSIAKMVQHRFNCHDDLLATLQAVVAISDRKHDAWDKARAAIAKARGE